MGTGRGHQVSHAFQDSFRALKHSLGPFSAAGPLMVMKPWVMDGHGGFMMGCPRHVFPWLLLVEVDKHGTIYQQQLHDPTVRNPNMSWGKKQLWNQRKVS